MEKYRKYSKEFKLQAAKLVTEQAYFLTLGKFMSFKPLSRNGRAYHQI